MALLLVATANYSMNAKTVKLNEQMLRGSATQLQQLAVLNDIRKELIELGKRIDGSNARNDNASKPGSDAP